LNDAVPNFDKDKAFERRFVIVELSEPTEVAGRWDFLQAFPL
jgi:ATP-dependent Clp protease ATP-binding subunit ClpA